MMVMMMIWRILVLGLFSVYHFAIFIHPSLADTVQPSDIIINLSLENEGTSAIASGLWKASFDYFLAPDQAGDTFVIRMPNVYRLNLGSTKTLTVTDADDGSTLFICNAVDGAYILDYSQLICTVGDVISNYYSGSFAFTIVFGVGGSTCPVELEEANDMTAGTYSFDWSGLTATAQLTGVDTPAYDFLYSYIHTTGYGTVEQYYLLPSCEGDYTSGEVTIIFNSGAANSIDCDNILAGATDNFNSWYLPKDNSYGSGVYASCDASSSTVTYDLLSLPPSYRPYLTVFQYLESSSQTSKNSFSFNLVCSISSDANSDTVFSWNKDVEKNIIVASLPTDQTAAPLEVFKKVYEGCTTSLSLDYSGSTGTVYVLTPSEGACVLSTTTITSSGSESYTTRSFFPTTAGSYTVTEVIVVPATTTTTTTIAWASEITSTSTYPFKDGDLTIIEVVEIPTTRTVKFTKTWDSAYTTTTTAPFSDGDLTETEIVDIPTTRTVTITNTWNSSYSTVTTSRYIEGDLTITEVVDIPSPIEFTTVTTTSIWSDLYTTTTTESFTSGDYAVTEVVDVPATRTTTITNTWDSTFSTTTTSPFVDGYLTITEVIDLPSPIESTTTTTTSTWTDSYTTTSTLLYSTGDYTITETIDVPQTRTISYINSWGPSYSTTSTAPYVDGHLTITEIIDVPNIVSSSSSLSSTSVPSSSSSVASSSSSVTSFSSCLYSSYVKPSSSSVVPSSSASSSIFSSASSLSSYDISSSVVSTTPSSSSVPTRSSTTPSSSVISSSSSSRSNTGTGTTDLHPISDNVSHGSSSASISLSSTVVPSSSSSSSFSSIIPIPSSSVVPSSSASFPSSSFDPSRTTLTVPSGETSISSSSSAPSISVIESSSFSVDVSFSTSVVVAFSSSEVVISSRSSSVSVVVSSTTVISNSIASSSILSFSSSPSSTALVTTVTSQPLTFSSIKPRYLNTSMDIMTSLRTFSSEYSLPQSSTSHSGASSPISIGFTETTGVSSAVFLFSSVYPLSSTFLVLVNISTPNGESAVSTATCNTPFTITFLTTTASLSTVKLSTSARPPTSITKRIVPPSRVIASCSVTLSSFASTFAAVSYIAETASSTADRTAPIKNIASTSTTPPYSTSTSTLQDPINQITFSDPTTGTISQFTQSIRTTILSSSSSISSSILSSTPLLTLFENSSSSIFSRSSRLMNAIAGSILMFGISFL